MPEEVILSTRNLTKYFDGFCAVNQVSLSVRTGTIHALIGPNGAGKTTFFNLLTHFLAPSAGSIIYKNLDITSNAAHDIADLGIVRSFQISAIFPQFTVLDNVRFALQRKHGLARKFLAPFRSLDVLNKKADQYLQKVGLEQYRLNYAGSLPYGQKRALEIATTLALEPEILLLDEPTQGMGMEDVDRTAELIKSIAGNRTILMVEHNLSVVADIADHITVMNQGAVLASGSYDVVSTDPNVIAAYIGSSRTHSEENNVGN